MNTDEKCLMITMIAFLALMLYYYVYRPSYVMDMDIEKNEKNEKNEKYISIRKCLVYSMLWSSALGLLFLFVMMFYKKNDKNSENNENKNKFSVEPPTFR